MTTLAAILRAVENGVFPEPDLGVSVVPAPSSRDACVLGFTGHIVVAADVDADWIAAELPPGDLAAPLNPPFLTALSAKTGRAVNAIDLMLLASSTSKAPAGLTEAEAPAGSTEAKAPAGLTEAAAPAGLTQAEVPAGLTQVKAPAGLTDAEAPAGLTQVEVPAGLTEVTDREHPRVRRALQFRDDVRVYADQQGGLVLTGRGLAGRWECAVEVPDTYRNAGAGRRLAAAARSLVPPDTSVWAQVTPGNAASLRAFLAAGFRPIGSEALLTTP